MTRQPINKILVLLTLLCLALGACGGGGDTAVTTTSSPTEATANALATRIMAGDAGETNTGNNTDFQQRLETAKTTWESHKIDDYTVSVRYNQPGWNTQFIDLTVQDGAVIDHKQDCFPPRDCTLQKIDPAEFTIDKLLIVAERVGHLNNPDHPSEITFSQTYGYPSSISYEDGFWSLTQFQPITP